MANKPLLIFPCAIDVQLPKGSGRPIPDKIRRPSWQQQEQRLVPQFDNMLQAFITNAVDGIEPEHVLVFETVKPIENFKNIVASIDGLEWLAEFDDELQPTDYFFETGKPEKNLKGRFYLSMSNRQGLERFISLFKNWHGNKANLPHRLGYLHDIFENIDNPRFWNENDRLLETGLLESWKENIEFYRQENKNIIFEIHLWYKSRWHSANSQADKNGVIANLHQLLENIGGRVLKQFEIKEISFLALKAELPAHKIDEILNSNYPDLIKCDDVMFFRPVGQQCGTLIPEENEIESFSQKDITGDPIVALLDGYPFGNHNALSGKLIIDDADEYLESYQFSEMKHGTSMASLICNGDLSDNEEPISHPLYVRPIMKPHPNNRGESIPETEFFEDLLERSVRRIFEGDVDNEAVASTVKVINLSIGDPSQIYTRQMSSIAKVIDWLSYKYNVLFLISAGNIQEKLFFNLSLTDFENLTNEERTEITLKQINREKWNRRLLAPAEAINAISVGALHHDNSVAIEISGRYDLYKNLQLPSPVSPLGFGFRNSVKPEILFPAGRQLYRYISSHAQIDMSPLPPGQKVATASTRQGDRNTFTYSRGTSNATALISRNAVKIYDALIELNSIYSVNPLSEAHIPLLIKTLLVHGSSWNGNSELIEKTLKQQGDREFKKVLTRFLGYGVPNIAKVLECTEQRATIIGFGTIKEKNKHEYRIPIPNSLRGEGVLRRIIVTMAWFSPINSNNRKYRVANLSISIANQKAKIGTDNNIGAYHHIVGKGTVQHQIFEGKKLTQFLDDDFIEIPVICKEDATSIPQEGIKYGIVVTLEVSETVNLPIYEEVKNKLNLQVGVYNDEI